MPRVVFVNPPHSCDDLSELSPPLGLLRLADIAARLDWNCEVVDLNLLWHTRMDLRGDFYAVAAELLLSSDADLYGFTSMCVDSHIAILLAQQIKRALPRTRTVFGGVHFSSIAEELLGRHAEIDCVVAGEGESLFADILRASRSSFRAPRLVRSHILNRQPLSEPVSSASVFDRVVLDDYLELNPFRKVDLEGGRGCRFRCSFCYSPGHYLGWRSGSDEERVAALTDLARRGVEHVFFVEDNFLNDSTSAVAFCDHLAAACSPMEWSCYATVLQLTPRVIEAMAKAGCRSVFIGIDAIGENSRHTYAKATARDETKWLETVRTCACHGIKPTCAFLTSPPSHECGVDFDETVRAAAAAAFSGALVRLNTLSYYPGTAAYSARSSGFAADDQRVNMLLDVPSVVEQNPLSIDSPSAFPFHNRYTDLQEWSLYIERVHSLFTLLFARAPELHALLSRSKSSATEIADLLLARTGSLRALPKQKRRPTTLEAFDDLLS